MSDILFDEPLAGVTRLTLNRPQQLNAFTYAMYAQLLEFLEKSRHDSKTRVIILTGNGKAFCAGHDLRSAGEPGWIDDPALGKAYRGKYTISELNRIPLRMRQLPQPVICAVNGAAAGIGYALALASDLCVAGKSAKFVNSIHNAAPGHELGLSSLLQRAVGSRRAAEIL